MFASSVAIYGNSEVDEVDETTPFCWQSAPSALALYGASKIIGKNLLRLYQQRCGLDYVAPALVCTVAVEILRRGRTYVKGQAVNNRAVQRLYDRCAMGFPGADYIIGGRAFRRLAELAGLPARVAVQSLPEKSWNYEP